MSNLNSEIEEASVGAMLPITTPDETLSKATPASIDDAFNALKLNVDSDETEECGDDDFDESAADLAAVVKAFKARKKFRRNIGNHKEECKEFIQVIGKVEKYLKEKDKDFVPYGSLKREVRAVSNEEKKEILKSGGFDGSDKNIKLSVMKFMNGDKIYCRLTIAQHPDKGNDSIEVGMDPMDAPMKYWNYYVDSIDVKYLHVPPAFLKDWKKIADKFEKGKDVKLEYVGDQLMENGIESVLYEHLKEWEKPEGVVFEESDVDDFMEAAKIDDDIKDIISTLNEKGYDTKYSCSGHPSARLKSDGKRDGIKDKKLYSTARVVFAKSYDFPSIPEGWEEKTFDNGSTGIYVKGPTFKIINGLPTEQFYKWKQKYMNHLEKWAKDLPNVDDLGKKSEEMDESVNEIFQDLVIDLS